MLQMNFQSLHQNTSLWRATAMVNSQIETLENPWRTPFEFPLHRRSHLKSQTFRNFSRILSLCSVSTHTSHLSQIDSKDPKSDNGNSELVEHTETEIHNGLACSDSTGPKKLLNQIETVVDRVNEAIGDRDTSQVQVPVEELQSGMTLKGTEEVVHDSIDMEASPEAKNESGDGVMTLNNNHECQVDTQKISDILLADKANHGTQNKDLGSKESIPASETGDCITKLYSNQEGQHDIQENLVTGPAKVDNDHYSRKDYDALDSSLNEDMKIDNQEKLSCNRNVLDEVKHRTEKDLGSKDTVSANGTSNIPIVEDGEIEEGEISNDSGFFNHSTDSFLEDAVTSEKVEKEITGIDIVNKEVICSGQNPAGEKAIESNSNMVDVLDCADNVIEADFKARKREVLECKSETFVRSYMLKRKRADQDYFVLEKQGSGAKDDLDGMPPCPDELGGRSGRTASEKQEISEAKDAGVHKKRKKGPCTEERKEKKKKRKKIKRAELNRKLGVKRLKLQPIMKPKTVTYCRHYMKGRCQQGDKCKFSHDTVPLTKSEPCCHFARHSCMKGDDCPYDHELSNYPCRNFETTGFCIRGDGCLFSHKVPSKENPSTSTPLTVTKPELKSTPTTSNSNSKKHSNTGTSRLVNTQNSTPPVFKAPSQASKGLSFPSLSSQTSQSASSSKIPNNRSPATITNRINILAFSKSVLDDSTCKKQESMRDGNVASEKLQTRSMKPSGPSLRSPQTPSVSSHERPNRTPIAPPKGITFFSFGDSISDRGTEKSTQSMKMALTRLQNSSITTPPKLPPDQSSVCRGVPSLSGQKDPTGDFLSFGKPSSDDSSRTKHDIMPFNQDRKAVSEKLENMLQKLRASSPTPPGQSAVRSSDGLSENTQSSVQKSLMSTLAFATRYESEMMSRSSGASAVGSGGNSQNVAKSSIYDILYGKSKQ